MDNVIGSASIVIRPEMSRFDAELEAKSAPALGGFSKRAEKAGAEGGQRLSKGFKTGVGGVTSALGAVGVPLQTFGGRLEHAADSMAHVDSAGGKLSATLATLGGRTLLGAAAGIVAVSAAGLDLAFKQERVVASIASSAHVSTEAAHEISTAFLSTVDVGEESGKALGAAYAEVAGVLGELEGKALDSGRAVKFMTSAEDLAIGAHLELQNATADLAKTLQAYHIGVDGAAGASDVLFNTSRVTGIQIDQLTTGLSRMKGQLGALAPDLHESAGWLDALAKAGITGRPAMSALSVSLGTLVSGGKKTTEMAKTLGLEIFDSSHKFVGMRSILEQLSPKLHELGQEQQIEATKALFGGKANRQLLDIILAGPGAFDAHTRAVSRAGTAHAAAAKQASTLEGKVKQLERDLENLATKIGEKLIPVLFELVGAIMTTVAWFEKHSAAAEGLAVVITSVLGAAIGAFVAEKVAAFVGGLQKMLRFVGLLGPATATAEAEMAAAEAGMVASADKAAAGVDAALVGTGIGAALVLLGVAAVELGDHWKEVMQGLEEAAQAMGNFVINILNELIGALNKAIEVLTFGLAPAISKIGELSGAGEGGSGGRGKGENLGKVDKVGASLSYLEGPSSDHTRSQAAYLEKLGLPALVAAGLAGNFAQEGVATDTGASGLGIGQWMGSRRAALEAFAKATHRKPTDEGAQLEFAAKELKGSYGSVYSAASRAGSPEHAARILAEGYERPKPSTANYGHREEAAAAAYKKHAAATHSDTVALQKHNKALEDAINSLLSPAKRHRSKQEGYVDPFVHATGVVRGREDEGIDFTAKAGSKIGAIGEGTINKIVANWFKGQPLVEELLTSGSHKGQHVYYAEQLTPGVRQGQHVRAGQTIGTVARSGTGLEFGFGAGGGRTLAQATTGYKEGEKTPAAAAFSKFLAEVGKGGSRLQQASAVFEAAAKAELAKQTADQKQGQGALSKMIVAIHSGNLQQLTKVVGGEHDKALAHLEKRLHDDHTAVLEKLRKQLVDAHTKALEALNKALVKAAEKAASERMSKEDAIHTDEADAAAAAIANATRVTLDHAAEVGKAGADLIAAQAQTHLDEVKAADEAAVSAAKLAVDRAAGTGEAAEAAARQALVNAENQAKVSEASAQQTLDLANSAATEAQKATEADERRKREGQEAEERARRESEGKGDASPAAAGSYTFYINGTDLAAADVMAEVGWALRTGSLPVAPPGAAHPVGSPA